MLEQAGVLIGVIGGVVVIGGGLLGLVAFAFIRRFDQERDAKQNDVMQLMREELDLHRQRAARVPELEQQVEVLREEVGAAKAIAEHDNRTQAELAKVQERIARHDERAARADAWQAAKNDALVEAVNRLLAQFHEKPVQITAPATEGHRGHGG